MGRLQQAHGKRANLRLGNGNLGIIYLLGIHISFGYTQLGANRQMQVIRCQREWGKNKDGCILRRTKKPEHFHFRIFFLMSFWYRSRTERPMPGAALLKFQKKRLSVLRHNAWACGTKNSSVLIPQGIQTSNCCPLCVRVDVRSSEGSSV